MVTLDDVLTNAIRKGYYRDTRTRDSSKIYQFTSFGSQCCSAHEYNLKGEVLAEVLIRTEDRHHYQLIPKEELATAFKRVKKSGRPSKDHRFLHA